MFGLLGLNVLFCGFIGFAWFGCAYYFIGGLLTWLGCDWDLLLRGLWIGFGFPVVGFIGMIVLNCWVFGVALSLFMVWFLVCGISCCLGYCALWVLGGFLMLEIAVGCLFDLTLCCCFDDAFRLLGLRVVMIVCLML